MNFKKQLSRLKQLFASLSGWKKWLLQFGIIVVVFVLVRAYQQRDVLTGLALPIQGQLTDQRVINWQDYRGKPLLLHFWATWCPVCRLEENSIESIAKDYQVLSIASWSENTPDYMEKNALSFATLDDINGVWATRYGIKGVPASFLINANGEIEFVETGYSSETGLRLRLWWIGL